MTGEARGLALDDRIATLARAPLFSDLEPDALRVVAGSGDTRRLRAGETLFREGERSDGGYVVLSGELAISRAATEAITLAGPGALIGRLALFLRQPRPASAVARARSEVIRISPTLMRRVLSEHPAAAARIREEIATDLDELGSGLERVRRMLTAIDGG